jgi:hypothetical protein
MGPDAATLWEQSTGNRIMQITVQSNDGQTTPVWITFLSQSDCDERNQAEGLRETSGDTLYEPGYYWAVCFPGCMPDSDFYGPFSFII